ncbi:MAG: hypothetical protein DME69_03475 [Verrucomicrobia bacterium]|nr:MAG: hypothetical protein DME69_03475 [Verrucomicrobiota bacterium]
MSTGELKDIIDRRTPEERKWMISYLFDKIFAVPELQQTAEELKELARRRGDLIAGRRSLSQAQAEKHWDELEKTRA